MNKERIKLIIKNMELLVQSLKTELKVEENVSYNYEEIASHIEDYDEVFYDDED